MRLQSINAAQNVQSGHSYVLRLLLTSTFSDVSTSKDVQPTQLQTDPWSSGRITSPSYELPLIHTTPAPCTESRQDFLAIHP